jgi:predicted Holliday junction resolvase-like endonuclease
MGLGSEILLIATLIKNNEARLISYIDYEMETVTLLAVLTHKEYDKGGVEEYLQPFVSLRIFHVLDTEFAGSPCKMVVFRQTDRTSCNFLAIADKMGRISWLRRRSRSWLVFR